VRKILSVSLLAILGSGTWVQTGHCGAIRISQIYAGGGGDASVTNPYDADFVELFNSSGTPVDVSSWLLAYGIPNGTTTFGCPGCSNAIPPGTSIASCSYFLIQLGSRAIGEGARLPTPDLIILNQDITGGGTLAVMSSGTPSGPCLSGPQIQDLVGWHSSVTCFQGHAAASGSVALAWLRKTGGMTQTNDNAADFEQGTPVPRTSASPRNPICIQTPARPTTWGLLKNVYR
jgi:hypothetical protein